MLFPLKHKVIIIGAGLAGLCCARHLHAHKIPFVVLEASDAVGGRVRTDLVNGFRLDRGFQVLLSSYPELKRWLNLEELQLRAFHSGARARYRGRFYELADPWRRPWTALMSAFTPIGTLADKMRVARLRSQSLAGTYQQRMHDPEQTTLEQLQQLGFSPQMIDSFLRPFLGGIFLDRELNTSSRMLNFVFRMFSIGDACLPAAGMQAIPEQLASSIPPESLRLNTTVVQVAPGSVTLQSGEQMMADHLVVAVDGPAAQQLLPSVGPTPGRGVHCLYFSATRPPFDQPILVLNGDGAGPINNLCVPSNVSATYAPSGQCLISVTVLDDWHDGESVAKESGTMGSGMGSGFGPVSGSAIGTTRSHGSGVVTPTAEDCRSTLGALESEVRKQLCEWYGQQVNAWSHLRTYTIPFALPDQASPALQTPERPVRLDDGIYVCGDHRDNASIEGAMVSGRRAAEAIVIG